MIFRYLTWMPDVVKYGISNLTLMGGLPSIRLPSTLGRKNWAFMRYSLPPGNDLMVQHTAPSSGTYLHWPIVVLNLGESASLGTGIMISTLLAVDLRLNWDLALTMISTLEWAWRSMQDSIQIRGFTWVFSLYDMSSNSPSGGMKEI